MDVNCGSAIGRYIAAVGILIDAHHTIAVIYTEEDKNRNGILCRYNMIVCRTEIIL